MISFTLHIIVLQIIMMSSANDRGKVTQPNTQPNAFKTTQWSMVLRLKASDDEVRAKELENLCRRYWYPVYSFIRSKKYNHSDAEDLSQSFFAVMLNKDVFLLADSSKGRFRTFLLTCLTRHLQQNHRKAQAQMRNPGEPVLSLDFDLGYQRFESMVEDPSLPPDKAWDRQWAQSVIRHVIRRLEKDFRDSGRINEYNAFRPFLTADKGEVTYKEVAVELSVGINTAKTSIYRFRQKYARFFREEIEQTIGDDEDIEEEIKALLTSLT